MAKSKFRFENSKPVTFVQATTTDFFLCNSLEEKKKYIYFKRGPFGTGNFQCGTEKTRMLKDGLKWDQTGQICDSGEAVWKVEAT